MPLYEYKCDNCGEVFEVRQKFVDEPVTVHEKCGGHVERLISRSAFQLKGSGWYATDYPKSGNGSKKTDSDSKTTSETATKSETKSEAKSETKSETKSTESKPASSDKSKSD